jgi:hypothetical protein
MDDDERKALGWLLGRGIETETVRTADSRRFEQHIGEMDGRATLVRVLRRQGELNGDIRNALANALEGVGSSAMRLELNLVRRTGRGRPRKSVKRAIQQLTLADKLEQCIGAAVEKGDKPYIATGEAAKKEKKARSTAYVALRSAKKAKAIRENN